MSRHFILIFAALFGLGLIANGAYMLAAPARWYLAVPGVTTTGAFNQHFVRDIGLIFSLVGAAMFVGAAHPPHRAVWWGAAALWLSGHALFHFCEVAVGLCAPSSLLRDFPAVTLPAFIAAALTIWASRDVTSARPASSTR